MFDASLNTVLCLHAFLQTQVVDPSAKFQIVENTPDDPRKRKPDITKATALLGWEPKVTPALTSQ